MGVWGELYCYNQKDVRLDHIWPTEGCIYVCNVTACASLQVRAGWYTLRIPLGKVPVFLEPYRYIEEIWGRLSFRLTGRQVDREP